VLQQPVLVIVQRGLKPVREINLHKVAAIGSAKTRLRQT
jgi:hypothetical protein